MKVLNPVSENIFVLVVLGWREFFIDFFIFKIDVCRLGVVDAVSELAQISTLSLRIIDMHLMILRILFQTCCLNQLLRSRFARLMLNILYLSMHVIIK